MRVGHLTCCVSQALWIRDDTARSLCAICLAALCIACGCRSDTRPQPPLPSAASSTTIGLAADLPAGDWRKPSGDDAGSRYSPLDQIRSSNVSALHVVTTFSTGIPNGHEGQPLIVNNTMYVVTPFPNNLIAVDLDQAGRRHQVDL